MRTVRVPIFLALFLSGLGVAGAQTWTPLANQPPFSAGNPLLLTDGTVIAHATCAPEWWRLTPDGNGSYINGTWSRIASLPDGYGPLYFASAVLPDGRVIVEGGEYNFCQAVWTMEDRQLPVGTLVYARHRANEMGTKWARNGLDGICRGNPRHLTVLSLPTRRSSWRHRMHAGTAFASGWPLRW